MAKYVLFSPVGGHDPVANYHDGAMLHICRCYKPEAVYLYLSQEMLERSRLDNRYVNALAKLSEFLNYKIDKIKLIEREELKNVQLFDSFYEDFEGIIDTIKKENPEAEILFNISSGTPAMKSSLNLISALSKHKIKAVQVVTPTGKENPKNDDPKSFDLDTWWELNEDNCSDFKNRCSELPQTNLMSKIKKEMIIKLIESYDYNAALMLSYDILEFIPKEAVSLLQAASSRVMLDRKGVSAALRNTEYDIFPIKTDGIKKDIFEYLLYLQLRQRQGNYAEFIRGITPVILNLFEECLQYNCGIKIKDYCVKKIKYDGHIYTISDSGIPMNSREVEAERYGSSTYYLSNEKLLKDEEGIKIKEILEKNFKSEVKEIPYASAHIYAILEEYLDNPELLSLLSEIRVVETEVRNITAHQIISVTDEWIKKKVMMRSDEILAKLKKLAVSSGIKIKNDYWNSYDDMNSKIVELIKL